MVAHAPRTRSGANGMTLVEIMITLVISSIIAASTFMFFAGQQRIYETQTKILNIQQSVWASTEVLSRYVRAAGSGMYECVRPANYANPTTGERLASTHPDDGPVTSGGTVITSLASRPQTGLRAYDQSGGAERIPPLWIVNNSTSDTIAGMAVVPNTDIITVALGNRTSGTDIDATLAQDVAQTDPGTVFNLVGSGTGGMFRAGEFILLLATPLWASGADPQVDRGCSLFQITTDPSGGTTLPHASGSPPGGSPWNPVTSVSAMLPTGGYTATQAGVRNFGTLTWVRFFIRNDPGTLPGSAASPPIPQLMMQALDLSGSATPQVLADGIEDLQVAFACDVGTIFGPNLSQLDGSLNEGSDDISRRSDEWWNNVPGDNLPALGATGFCNLPTAVRLTLVARSLTSDDLIDPAVTGNGPADIEDHRYSPRPIDQFRRRTLTTTVYPRNNKPL